MDDLTLGIMRPSGAAGVLERAAEKLGVPVPPSDEARLLRVAMAIAEVDGCEWARMFQPRKSMFLAFARAAIAAYAAP